MSKQINALCHSIIYRLNELYYCVICRHDGIDWFRSIDDNMIFANGISLLDNHFFINSFVMLCFSSNT